MADIHGMTEMPRENPHAPAPDLEEILKACEPGATEEFRKSTLERLLSTEPRDEHTAGARAFLEANGQDFDALHRFLTSPPGSMRRRRTRRLVASLSMAACLVVLLGLGFRYARETRHRIMQGHLFNESGLPVFASLDGDRDFHDMMSAYRTGEVEEGLLLLRRLESRDGAPNDTLSYYGGWLHYMDRGYAKAEERFSNAAGDSLSVFRDKALLMTAASQCLGKRMYEASRLLKSLEKDPRYTMRREAEAILTDKRLW